ncbi:MAG TPA: PEP-CTERM sorting domain-containing protein [Gemmatimonadales bacterium]|jgi:hypothetical protein
MKSSQVTAVARTTLATFAVALFCAPVAHAQQSFGLFSTGINSSGTTIATGSQDPYWTWQQASAADYPNIVLTGSPNETYVPTNEFGDWQPDVADQYHWVSSTSNAAGNGGYSLWSTTFDLTDYDPTTATITFKCVADNVFIRILLNGVASTTASCGGSYNDYKFGSDYTLASGFVAGDNTLSIFTTGDGQTDGILFDVENAQAVYSPPVTGATPEPASVLLMATGLVGLVPALRRRRRA